MLIVMQYFGNMKINKIMQDRRFKLLKDIMDKAKKDANTKTKLYCLIAAMTDKRLTKFHKEFMNKCQ